MEMSAGKNKKEKHISPGNLVTYNLSLATIGTGIFVASDFAFNAVKEEYNLINEGYNRDGYSDVKRELTELLNKSINQKEPISKESLGTISDQLGELVLNSHHEESNILLTKMIGQLDNAKNNSYTGFKAFDKTEINNIINNTYFTVHTAENSINKELKSLENTQYGIAVPTLMIFAGLVYASVRKYIKFNKQKK